METEGRKIVQENEMGGISAFCRTAAVDQVIELLQNRPINGAVKSVPSAAKRGEVCGADALIRMLIDEGVDLVFGYPGGAIMPVYDALLDYSEEIHHVLVRHEQGAAHAAEGYARATGRVGVCFATSGPGATNLVTGIADAMMDSVPMVCITGQVVSSLLGRDAFQETDIVSITMPVTKWNCQVQRASEIPAAVRKAFRIARSGRPGPVLIDITKDAQKGSFRWEDIEEDEEFTGRKEASISGDLEAAARLINEAERPLLLVGQGVLISGAEKEIRVLAEKADIPTACTLLGISACPTDHPLFVGMIGMHGYYAPNMLTNKADVIIAVGMRFDDRVTGDLGRYARQAKIIHIEIDAAEIGKNIVPTVPILGDARKVLSKLLPLVKMRAHAEWRREFAALRAHEEEVVIQKAIAPQEGKIRMGEVVDAVGKASGGKAIIVSDVGQHQMMAARYSHCKLTRSFITSGGLGTMGFALPAAIGAQFGAGSRQVVAICGDGSFQMTMQELGTIAQEGLPVKIIIMNNGYLGMVRQWQELFHGRRYSSVALTNPDYPKLCSAFGIEAVRVSQREDLGPAVSRMLSAPGPYCLEVLVQEEHNVFPMVPAGAAVDEMILREDD